MSAENKTSKMTWIALALVGKATKLVKLAKLFKVTKVLLMFSTMALSALVYSLNWGVWFGIGFVLLLFVHEMGHIVALNYKGYRTSAPVFIPMLGAVIFAPKFRTDEEEALIGFGGPLAGTLASAVLSGVYLALPTKHEILLLLSYVSAYLNLFNLLPIRPLDGGRVMQVVGAWSKWVGLAVLFAFSLYVHQPFVFYIWILVMNDLEMRPTLRLYLSTGCLAAMGGLMAAGFSNQGRLWDAMDCLIGVGFVFLAYRRTWSDDVEEPADVRIRASGKQRAMWFAFYAVLAVGLVCLLGSQVHHLPAQLRKQ